MSFVHVEYGPGTSLAAQLLHVSNRLVNVLGNACEFDVAEIVDPIFDPVLLTIAHVGDREGANDN